MNTVTFPAFMPEDRKFYRAVVYVTDSRDPDPTYDTAETRLRTHVRVGDVLETFPLRTDPLLGQNFWFITYSKAYHRFFISDYYGAVYSFDPDNPMGTFRIELWAYAPIYDPYLNHPFGIAVDDDSLFFLSHLEYDGWYVYGQHLATYSEVSPGLFAWTGDSLEILSLGGVGIVYGMDWHTGERDALWMVKSDGTISVALKINPATGSVRRTVPLTGLADIPTGIAHLSYTGELLLTDGKKVYRIDTTGTIVDAYYTPGNLPLYDLDLYEGCSAGSTDPVVAYAVTLDTLNTVHIVATGYYCDQVVSVAERPKVEKEKVSLYVSGRTVRLRGAEGVAYVYDLSGRKVGAFKASESFTLGRSGVFFIKAKDRVFKVVVR